LQAVLLIVAALAGYLAFWPVPIEPVAWQAPASPGYAGSHAANARLGAVHVVSLAPEIGPEHIDFGPDGKLYTGLLSGAVLRMNADGSQPETVVNTGGRPLGFDFTTDGQLVIADAIKGLVAVQADGALRVLADSVDGDPIRYADAVVIAADGARRARHVRCGAARRTRALVHRTRAGSRARLRPHVSVDAEPLLPERRRALRR